MYKDTTAHWRRKLALNQNETGSPVEFLLIFEDFKYLKGCSDNGANKHFHVYVNILHSKQRCKPVVGLWLQSIQLIGLLHFLLGHRHQLRFKVL